MFIRPGLLAALTAAATTLVAASLGCEGPPARTEPPPPKVSVSHPQTRELIDSDEYNGWIDAAQTVEVRSRVRGHIQKVHFTDGQIVKQGDLLFELDPRPFQQEIDRTVEQVGIYDSQLKFALVEEKRLKQMGTNNVASPIEIESAEAKARSFESQVEATKKEVERDRLELEYSRITAPISGRISRAMMTEGNLVNAGGSDPLLTTIVSVDPIYVYFDVDERALQRWRKQRAAAEGTAPRTLRDAKVAITFGLETDQGYPREGMLDFADNQVNKTTGTIVVRAVVPNPNGDLVAGSRVRVRVPTSAEHKVTVIPDTAVLSDQDKKYVLVVGEKNVVERRDVTLGRLLDDGMRIVIAPPAPARALAPEDRIIVMGLQMARVNYPVEPVTPATPASPATQPGAAPAQASASASPGNAQ